MYMFRPIAAIIMFSFESMVVALIGLVWLYHDGEISTSVMCVILVCIAQVFWSLLSYMNLQLLSISGVYC